MKTQWIELTDEQRRFLARMVAADAQATRYMMGVLENADSASSASYERTGLSLVQLNSRFAMLGALAIAAEAGQWTRLPTGAYVIPSQSEPGTSYRVTPQSCSCPDSDRHPERLCKHATAVAIYLALSEAAS